jgi:hypothetical protein
MSYVSDENENNNEETFDGFDQEAFMEECKTESKQKSSHHKEEKNCKPKRKRKRSKDRKQGEDSKSQSSWLIKFMDERITDIFHSPDGIGYCRIGVKYWDLSAKPFSHFMSSVYYEITGKTVGGDSIKQVLDLLCHKSQAVEKTVYKRVARLGGAIYWNLADDAGRVIKITANGWTVENKAPVIFIPSVDTAALPVPIKGDLEPLRKLLPLNEQQWVIAQGIMLDVLKGRGPHMITYVTGPQGSGKTIFASMLKGATDPVKTATKISLPDDPRDLPVIRNLTHFPILDNVSYIKQWFSNLLCLAATGGTKVTRSLYSNNEPNIMQLSQPMILTGIPDFANQPDLISRLCPVELIPIPQGNRRTEKELWAEFYSELPFIMGGLCDLLCKGLANEGTIKIPEVRMIDSAQWICSALGSSEFADYYAEVVDAAGILALQSKPFYEPLMKMMAGYDVWKGSAGELLDKLKVMAMPVDGNYHYMPAIPKTPQYLSSALRECNEPLSKVGLKVESYKSNGIKVMSITKDKLLYDKYI